MLAKTNEYGIFQFYPSVSLQTGILVWKKGNTHVLKKAKEKLLWYHIWIRSISMNLRYFMFKFVYFLALSTEKAQKQWVSLALSLWRWNAASHLNRNKQLFGEISGSRSGQEMFRISLDHLVMLDSKEAINRYWGSCQKDSRAILKRFPLAKDGTVWASIMIIAIDWNMSNIFKSSWWYFKNWFPWD